MSEVSKETDVDAFIQDIRETGMLPSKRISTNVTIESRIMDTANQLYEWLIAKE